MHKVALALLVLFASNEAQGALVSIPATSNIYLTAGNTYTSGSCGQVSQSGCLGATPVQVDLGAAAIFVTVTGVTGSVGYISDLAVAGPDGNLLLGSTQGSGGTNVPAGGVLSGFTFGAGQFSLVGVFLGPFLPGAAPGNFDSGNGTAPAYSPGLGQIFFIGDGLTGTGSGSEQTFFVPVGATRLGLGFVDQFYNFTACSGGPCTAGLYGDNLVEGHLALGANVNINGAINGAIPEPASVVLLTAGLLGIIARRNLRSAQ